MEINFSDPEQIKQLISALQNMLPKTDIKNDAEDSEDEIYSESKIKTKTTKLRSSKQKNKFVDMPERNMHKSDSAIDKKLAINPPTPRNRKFVPVNVICRICGKQEQVNPGVVPESIDRYKCNKCSSSSGR